MSLKKITVTECIIPIDENTKLNGNLYLPESEFKVPVIVMRTPYGKHNINAVFDPIEIVRHGFALLAQNVRGRFESDGIYCPFENERDDGNLTVRWLIEQEWCNGNVYSLGVSYEGFTSLLLAVNNHTKAVAPIMSSSNIYRDWFFENGFIKQGFVQSWSHSFGFTDNGNLLPFNVIDYIQLLANDIKSLYYGHLSDFPISKYLDYYNAWINCNMHKYWDNISKQTKVNDEVPKYYVSGWYDIFCEGTLKQFHEEIEKNCNTPMKLVVGPWSHTELFGSVVGDIDFGVYSLEKYSSMDIVEWFEKIEKKEELQTVIWLYVMGINKWYKCSEFPKPLYLKYYFIQEHNNGILSRKYLKGMEDTAIYLFDANDPVPTCGGRCIDAIPEGQGGPKIQNYIETRADVLTYSSLPVEERLSIIGEVYITLSCKSEFDKMDYLIKLCDVDEKGKSINILDSGLRVEELANKKKSYRICIGTAAHCFLVGHRIRCSITSSNFPRLNIQDDLLNKKGENTIYLDGSTAIELPVVEIGYDEK